MHAQSSYPSFPDDADTTNMYGQPIPETSTFFKGYPKPYAIHCGFETWSEEGTSVRIQPEKTKILSRDHTENEEDERSEGVIPGKHLESCQSDFHGN